MNGVSVRRRRRRRLCLAGAADVGDVETGVTRTGGQVASGRQSGHFQTSAERRVAVDVDARRTFAHDEQLIVE